MGVRSTLRRVAGHFLGDSSERLQRMIFREAARGFPLAQSGFPGTLALPREFGRRMPERVVELLLAHTVYAPGARVLDVGHSNIMLCHRMLLERLAPPRRLTGIDIAPPAYDTRSLYERSVVADITRTGMEAASFDRIWCISTLEHVGMDNTVYTTNFRRGGGMDAAAIAEMARLLAPAGQLLITVPFGKFEDHGWFRNYDLRSWRALLAPLRSGADVHELYFAYSPDAGWTAAEPEGLSATGYNDNANAGASGLAVAMVCTPPGRNERNPEAHSQ